MKILLRLLHEKAGFYGDAVRWERKLQFDVGVKKRWVLLFIDMSANDFALLVLDSISEDAHGRNKFKSNIVLLHSPLNLLFNLICPNWCIYTELLVRWRKKWFYCLFYIYLTLKLFVHKSCSILVVKCTTDNNQTFCSESEMILVLHVLIHETHTNKVKLHAKSKNTVLSALFIILRLKMILEYKTNSYLENHQHNGLPFISYTKIKTKRNKRKWNHICDDFTCARFASRQKKGE